MELIKLLGLTGFIIFSDLRLPGYKEFIFFGGGGGGDRVAIFVNFLI